MRRKLHLLSHVVVMLLLVLPLSIGSSAQLTTAHDDTGSGLATGQTTSTKQAFQPRPIYHSDGTIDIGPIVRSKNLPLEAIQLPPSIQAAPTQSVSYTVGMTRTFVVLNDVLGRYQLATYDVRYISDTVEVWVQSDLRYRNADGTVNPVHPDARDPEYVTQERIEALAEETAKIVPADVEYFGDYASRDGSQAALPDQVGLPPDYYAGPGKRVIVLVSNVRDANFYDPLNNSSSIAGFYSPSVNAFADRNIITIDSKRWNTRVGPPSYDYESTIAHEFQHLINGDYDDDEELWANEGRSEFAEFLLGYRPTPSAHRTQWSDFPENSLVLWGDQDADPDQDFEILADYQQAYWFFLYLAGRLQAAGINVANDQYLKDVSQLTSDEANGIASIDAMLQRVGAPFRFQQVWNDFRTDMLFGGTSDQTPWGNYISTHQGESGVPIAALDLGLLRRNLDFEGYDTPGAPPYGSDYIEIGWSPAISETTPIAFNGNTNPISTTWNVIPANSTGITPTGTVSGTVLYSGHTDLTDNFLIFPVTVPINGNQTLSFDTMYNIEQGWDFGFVQVTEDTAGATGFVSLPVSGTTTISDTDALPLIKSNVPGFSGLSGVSGPIDPEADTPSWVQVTYDMSAYAGENILLAFRYSTDPATAGTIEPPPEPGWYLDNIRVGNTSLYTDEVEIPATAESIWQARNKGSQFKVDLVTFADKNGAAISEVVPVPLDANGDSTFNLGSLLGKEGFNEAGERIVALVSTIPPTPDTDLVGPVPTEYGSYTLTGLPPSVYTSRARAIGTASNATIANPSVFPGDVFTVTVSLDNFGRNDDLAAAAAAETYVAVPIPANSTFVAGSFTSDVAPGQFQFVENLQTVASTLPAQPGIVWNGEVTRTADLAFGLRAAQPLSTTNTTIAPIAYIANAPFNANPSQLFTDLEAPVRVVSPFELSAAVGPATVPLSSTAVFTYTLLNTDDQPREVDFQFDVPAGASLASFTAVAKGISEEESDVAIQATETRRLTVPSYLATEQVLEVTVALNVSLDFIGTTLDPKAVVLQPGSTIPYVVPVVINGESSGPATITGRVYLPLVYKAP